MTDIINPADIAVALKYDGQNAPTITAKGSGSLAQEIIDLAIANDIPLDNNPELVKILSSIPLGEEIPEALYIAVAEVIAFAYLLSDKIPDNVSNK
ncbi:MAG: EscU/YscU/HrcU family type III secretion system export apparatus switch protein [Cycloclasticus sp.]|jgi:flagellar biosynthesis protein|nr:MAG: flagellar protein FhlB [Cycloclasticus sp. Phe_18]MBV1911990.1 EscU/YscU/HrcU family type III secretion system export apparatus switch protein [Cycloclasticus sp.]MDF1690144.1 EscU/YscU/HrcU family type III secretion system export apparatus switch protein [Cycloclasticus sp.]MEE4291086.1 EscU/YscU/HrcU family type III secretion system export apparatus switch protein [Cycloclasticus sp.]